MYFVLEIQQQQDGSAAHIVSQHSARNEAESKYHQVLSAAAVSSVYIHSAVIFDEEGIALANASYHHEGE